MINPKRRQKPLYSNQNKTKMKRVLIVFLWVLPLIALAQSPLSFEIGTRSGYEYNVFNAHPSRVLISEEGDTTSSVRSGFFQHFNV